MGSVAYGWDNNMQHALKLPDTLKNADTNPVSMKRRVPSYRATLSVGQGDCMVISDPTAALQTILGSCISACIYDPRANIGGMNHFLLPTHGSNSDSASWRYGCFAMESLINQVLLRGCGKREYLEVKVFGGGNIQAGNGTIGHDNADFVESFLNREGLRVIAKDLRGSEPRKVLFHPTSGKAFMKHSKGDVFALAQKELSDAKKAVEIKTDKYASDDDIELF